MDVARTVPVLVTLTFALGACSPGPDTPVQRIDAPDHTKRVFYLEAPCEVMVDGVGMVDVETEYLPGVVACENGNAPEEALKAQAVQARTFLYYKLFVAGQDSIGNSTSDQVFSCSYRPNGPGPEHVQAVADTQGQYLTFEDSIIASFYVAAAIPPNPDAGAPYTSCQGNGGDDPTGTENLVTYNKGKTGCDIEMSAQGSRPADCRDNPYNRGTASQNGEACLASVGVTYDDMFAMYYGEDIELVVADGRCGGDLLPEDEFCGDAGDGMHCFDDMTRIECEGGRASMTEECPFGCEAGVCQPEPNDDFCAGRDDGPHCSDATTLVQCAGEMTSMTEACDFGCGEGMCVPEPDEGFCDGRANGAYCDGSVRVECVGEAITNSAACPSGCTDGACDASEGGSNGGEDDVGGGGDDVDDVDDDGGREQTTSQELPPLVGPSPGVSGGCSTARGGLEPWLLVLGLLFGFHRRRRRR